jgi:HNH endonuclease
MGGTGMNNWKGGRTRTSHGYIWIYRPDHPRAIHGRYIYEHVAIAEHALGRVMPDGVEVHHVNDIRDDNRSGNLVICQDKSFHKLLHKRERALIACGHADWVCCAYCGNHGPPESMYLTPNGRKHWHRACQRHKRIDGTKPVWVVPVANVDK